MQWAGRVDHLNVRLGGSVGVLLLEEVVGLPVWRRQRQADLLADPGELPGRRPALEASVPRAGAAAALIPGDEDKAERGGCLPRGDHEVVAAYGERAERVLVVLAGHAAVGGVNRTGPLTARRADRPPPGA